MSEQDYILRLLLTIRQLNAYSGLKQVILLILVLCHLIFDYLSSPILPVGYFCLFLYVATSSTFAYIQLVVLKCLIYASFINDDSSNSIP